MGQIQRFGRRFYRYWFELRTDYQYGVLRIFVFGWLWAYWNTAFYPMDLKDLPLEFFEPSFASTWLSPSREFVTNHADDILTAFNVLIPMCVLGVFTRISTVACVYLMWVYEGVRNSFGQMNHGTEGLVLLLLPLALAPGLSSYSVDRLVLGAIRKLRNAEFSIQGYLMGGPVPAWPAKAMLCTLVLIYFSSGLSKIRYGGWQWIDGQTLSFYFSPKMSRSRVSMSTLNEHYYSVATGIPESARWKDGVGLESFTIQTGRSRPIAHKIHEYLPFISFLSACTVLLELSAPLLLVSRVSAMVYVLALIVFHFSIGAMLSLDFSKVYGPMFALVIDWQFVFACLSARMARFRSPFAGQRAQ